MEPDFKQAPPSPEGVPNIPDVVGVPSTPDAGGAELSQEQMRANLDEMMNKIQGKYQDITAQKASVDNQNKKMNSEALREIFDILQSQGVDPSKPEEVKAFMDKIAQTNPDLYQQIETAIQGIMGEEDIAGPEAGMASPVGPAVEPQMQPQMPGESNMNMSQNDTPQENL